MPSYFFQIKARDDSDFGDWKWPPMFSGKVESENRKEARRKVEEEFDETLPVRVLKKDREHHPYLLLIRDMPEKDARTWALFDWRACVICGSQFRVIDKYNDPNEHDKGTECCGQSCRQTQRQAERTFGSAAKINSGKGVIYRITHTPTQKHYIGKTTQVFTLRWYQHFFQGGNTKFHHMIKTTPLNEWQFAIEEVVDVPGDADPIEHISQREQHWIDHYNALKEGLNSVPAKQSASTEEKVTS